MENMSDDCNYSTLTPTEGSKEHGIKVFNVVVNFVVLLVGVPGNLLIIRVYCAKTIKKSTHVLIMSLAWVDLIACIMSFVDIVPQFLLLARVEKPEAFRLLFTLRKMIVSSSVLITGVIAADRYDCVCRPRSRFFTRRRAKKAALASVVFALIVNSPGIVALYIDNPMIWDYMLVVFQTICFLTSVVTIVFCYTQVYRVIKRHVRVSGRHVGVGTSTDSSRRYESTTSGIAKDKCPPSSSDQVSYTRHHPDAVKLNTNRPRESSSDGIQSKNVQGRVSPDEECPITQNETDIQDATAPEKDRFIGRDKSKHPTIPRDSQSIHSAVLQRKTTKMLFITSLVFLITWFPFWIMIAVNILDSGGSNVSPKVLVIVEELSLTLLINNAVNPFIYGIANRRFRKDCKGVLQNMKLC